MNTTTDKLSTFDAEVTDTFGGETNYSWVRRASFHAPRDASDTVLVRMGKVALGMTGQRCVRSTYGDTIQLDVVGACVRAFITFRDEPTND